MNQDKRSNYALKTSHARKAAIESGLLAGFKTGLISVPIVLGLNKGYPPFKARLNVSARTAIAISPPLFAFAFTAERVAAKLANPDAFGSGFDWEMFRRHLELPIHKRAANYFYHNPFKTIIFTSIPVICGIYVTRDAKHLKLSQRIMHTRVLGQFSVLVILASTMLFHDWMDKRGPFTS
eukprot:snap_masked-scaffold_8-processed-gene-3.47-mRNA-1 protein AED:0.10 eAED:0.20 QI:0/-1/0/1/-1/1/1/0/179